MGTGAALLGLVAGFETRRWAPVLPDDAWEPLLLAAERHGLLGVLHRTAAGGVLPEAAAERCRAAYQEQAATALLARRQLRELGTAFSAAGISLVVLKGGSAIVSLYPDAACRRISDLDFLIPSGAVSGARRVMAGLGYTPVENRSSEVEEEALARFTHLRPYRRHGRLAVELHVSVLQGRVSRADDLRIHSVVLERSEPLTRYPGVSRLEDLDFALHTAVHLSRDLSAGFAALKGLVDLSLAAGRRERFWPELWARGREWGCTAEVERIAATLGELQGVPVEGLPSAPPIAAQRLLEPGNPEAADTARRYGAMLTAVWEAPGFKARVRYLRDLAFPSEARLRRQYLIPDKSPVLPYRARHAWEAARRALRGFRRRG